MSNLTELPQFRYDPDSERMFLQNPGITGGWVELTSYTGECYSDEEFARFETLGVVTVDE